MRNVFFAIGMLLGSATSAMAQVSIGIGIGLPGMSIGINLPAYPDMVPVPGYPVYYAPQQNSNFFFYDGMYWVYQGDNWYASSWYNGPWNRVGPAYVPLYILRVPVRYYRTPPSYFQGWQQDAPPRWGNHWGQGWEQQRKGWDKWNRSAAPAPAPLPVYQRQYYGDRYPQAQQQHQIHDQYYRYQPRDSVVRRQVQEETRQRASAPSPRGQQSDQVQHGSPNHSRAQQVQRPDDDKQNSAPAPTPNQRIGQAVHDQRQQPRQGADKQRQNSTGQRDQPAPRSQQAPRANPEDAPADKDASQEQRQDKGRGQGREKDDGRGKDK